jgi:hypothetical protein
MRFAIRVAPENRYLYLRQPQGETAELMVAIEYILLGAAILLLLSIFASKASGRLGVPALVLFLLIGMFAGSEPHLKILCAERKDHEKAAGCVWCHAHHTECSLPT